ncbi:hypothetical protein BCT30_16565 [Enterovibrio norvegicus]|uniref:hypothetical protein n=1 Tax=Enterovibrio norvegicus TaxID=188144 RepID=UPI000C8311F4|nr:hypothetical protein [Enterovibrio norvegicus]MCC4796840.1 hypothetical protein [Enterovibrio norvegicus]PMI35146.1 hypothetical protein BCU46_19680 [Enterovibrio norvegicus]PMN50495.1 hypothetical protein BCT30_16565 [Enterovibrio norvegicus]
MKRISILYTVSICISNYAYSADFDNCKVTEIIAAGPTNGHVALDCIIEPRPACASAGNFFGFDKSTDEGKQYMSMVLTAFASNATLTGYVIDSQCSLHQGNVALLEHLRLRK